jgi:hypothetical protein
VRGTLHVATLLAVAACADRAPAPALPPTLAETGLFDHPDVLPFTPQYPLWSDGATKRRWIALPEDAAIDASRVDAWEFPVGTRLWKEFSFGGARVETRYMTLTSEGWKYGTYVWSADGTTATLAPASGMESVEIAPGVRHKIPSLADCRACHASSPMPVLGFSALQLSPDRDPNAPHREQAGGVDLPALVAAGRVRGLAPEHLATPPRLPGPPLERAALGYLHANCGGCHRDDGPLATVGMVLAHSIEAPGAARRTAVGQPSQFMAPALRVAPGAHGRSVLFARMSARTPLEQMPPLGTQLVDAEATRLLADWIDQLAE